jgi:acyl-CoA synthetase (NDP forming)
MDKFFNPASIAVVGASNSAFNLGSSICRILIHLKYNGKVYAVNRKGEEVCGCPGYSSVQDIPGEVELAVMMTSAASTPELVRECGKKGIKNLIIESSGFTEEGEDGKKLQDEIDSIAHEYGIRFMGPNCLGVFNSHNNFCCFYGIVPGMYDKVFEKKGSISYIIQSGGIAALIIDTFQTDIVNVNKMISIGNKADVDEADFLEYLNNDETTHVVGMYLENVKDGRRLMEAAKKSKKPILAFKIGRTNEGARAASSHTAGMANNDVIFDSACRQSGIIRLKSIDELHSLPKIFTAMPALKGKRIVVFTNSGAFGGITSDILVEAGLEVVKLSEETQQKLAKTGKLFNASNPIDLGPALSLETFRNIFEILLSSDEVDGILAIPNVWQKVVIDTIIELVGLCKKFDKPAAIYIPNAINRILSIRNEYQIPVFTSADEAVRALSVSLQQYKFMQKKGGLI